MLSRKYIEKIRRMDSQYGEPEHSFSPSWHENQGRPEQTFSPSWHADQTRSNIQETLNEQLPDTSNKVE